MKLKKIFYAFFALALITAFFSGCSNLIEEKESSSAKKGRLLFSVNSSARNASTINPTTFDFENDSDLRFILTGTLNGTSETETLGTWSDSDDGTKAYSLMTSDTSILVDMGTWTFRLSVRTKVAEEVYFEVLYGNLTKTIVQGNNSLDFGTLNEASEDDATRGSGAEVAKGSVNLTLSFPAGKITWADGELHEVGKQTKEIFVEATLGITRGDDNDSVTFSTYKYELEPGIYIVTIRLYFEGGGESICTKYTALVVVAPGAESKAERSIDLLNALYTINYELEGGTFANSETITTSYNPCDKFTLPTPTKADYTFLGWSLSEPTENTVPNYADGEEISISKDTTLYALWTPTVYTITYEYEQKVSDLSMVINSNVTTYTIEDDVTLSEPEYEDYVLYGWYENSDFSADKIEGWNAGEKTGNITLYAKCGEGKTTASKIVERIKNMTESGVLIASGEFSTDLIREINAALKKLANTDGRSDVLVTLDLSGVTGLTELEEASSTNSSYSFYNCKNLKGIVLPDTITSIGESAFYGCTSLASITIPDGITSIEESTFYGCTSLANITIPDTVTSIGNYAFKSCGLSSITIPAKVTKIGIYAFSGCTTLGYAKFKDTIYWYYTKSSDYTDGTKFSGITSADGKDFISDLDYHEKAVKYLTSTYSSYYWYKE